MLHTYLLTGGDHLINLIAFAAYGGSIVGVSAIAGAFGLTPRAQAIAALFCATLPNAILQASGAKNDFLLAFWLVCAVYFAVRRDALFLALSVALALATKATAYLFLPPLLLYAVFVFPRRKLVWIAAADPRSSTDRSTSATSNSPAPRSASIPPRAMASSAGATNIPAWSSLVSNVLRHTSEQLGARSPRWNQAVYDAVAPRPPRARHRPPRSRHHLARRPLRPARQRQSRSQRQQPLAPAALRHRRALRRRHAQSHLEPLRRRPARRLPALLPLPEMAALPGAPGTAALRSRRAARRLLALEKLRYPAIALAVCLFLVNNARPALFENWTRPLQGSAQPLRHRPRRQLFHRHVAVEQPRLLPGIRGPHGALRLRRWSASTSARISSSTPSRPCSASAIRASASSTPCPASASAERPCAVLCPDCIANQQKIALYRASDRPSKSAASCSF